MTTPTTLAQNLEQSVATMREANEKALAQKADKGYVDAQLQERVDKLNAQIDEQIDALEKRQAEIERAAQLGNVLGDGKGKGELIKAAQFFANCKGVDEVTAEQYQAYCERFGGFVRKGDAHWTPEMHAAMSVGSDPDGGYFVPADMSGRIVTKIYESSPVRQYASVQTISSDAYEGVDDLDEAGAGWVGEQGARSETTTPQVQKWRIPVHEMYAEPKATQKLLDDAAVPVESWLGDKVSNRFSRLENAAFVTGDGNLKPRGFLDYPMATTDDDSRAWGTVQYFVTGASGAFASSNPGDVLISALFALKDQYGMNAVWAMRRATEAAVRKLKDGDGNYLWQPDFTAKSQRSILGQPVAGFQDMPAIAADSYSIAVADFAEAYQIVDRIGIRILRDPYTSKPYVKFYTTKRVGGGLINSEALKVIKFGTS